MPTPATARTFRHRAGAFVAAVLVMATGTVFWAAPPAAAAPLSDQCSVQQWQDPGQWDTCVGKLNGLTAETLKCAKAPPPESPDSGVAGWFASAPNTPESMVNGRYMTYGYGGYDFTTYAIYDDPSNCIVTIMHPDYKFENTIANGEFMIATGIVGAANSLREKAWDPQSMWGWSDSLVDKATRAIYERVFSVFGVITIAVVGLYLLWRSRQSDMNNAMTTAGWAIFIMVVVTAIAAWPVRSAHFADQSLTTGLSAVQSAVGPPAQETNAADCAATNFHVPVQCIDHRTPAQRASDMAVENILYRNWLRGTLGSADSETAKKYGPILYNSKTFTWKQIQDIRDFQQSDHYDPQAGKMHSAVVEDDYIKTKNEQWEKVAQQIQFENPEAYQYLQGTKGMDRIGSGFIAILSAIFFAMFDITASILVLLGFLIFRWAVIVAPILGTVGLFRPASAGVRRLANAVIAAIFNIIIFGTGSAIYLFAVDLIMSTATIPAWLQVTLVWLSGIVGWLLLRPYRRITQLGGRDSAAQIASAGSWHRNFFRDLRTAATLGVATPVVESAMERRRGPIPENPGTPRPETRAEDGTPDVRVERPVRTEDRTLPEERTARPVRHRRSPQWTEPDVTEPSPSYAVYRPGGSTDTAAPTPVRRPESLNVRG